MDKIDELITRVLKREGGDAYTNDPSDAGGPTKYGITLGALHNWRKAPVTAEDVRDLTEAEARMIYRKNYFPAGFEAIPEPILLELLFDYSVTSGRGAMVTAVQNVLKRLGKYSGPIDGDFGPKSRDALATVTNWAAMFYAVKCERYELTQRYIGRAPENAKYAIGWSNRNDQFEMQF